LKEGLEKLFRLQQLDDAIKSHQTQLKQLPQTILEIEHERDSKKEMIETSKSKLAENLKAREKYEKEIQLVKEKIKKYKEQMTKATSNKEYQGFMAEIRYEEESIQKIEEKIIEKMLESDEILGEIRNSEAEFAQIADGYNEKIAALQQQITEIEKKIEETSRNRQFVHDDVPPPFLKIYENLFMKKAGKVVSKVESDFCGVCNVKIRPQILSELVTSSDIQVCENCGRILFKVSPTKDASPGKDD